VNAKIVVALIGIALYLVVLAQNTEMVSVKFLFWETAMSRIVLMTIMGIIGFIFGYVLARYSGRYKDAEKRG
jgi:uncharacterized integral membrane protein